MKRKVSKYDYVRLNDEFHAQTSDRRSRSESGNR